jgi:hypothetical protein
MLVRPIPTVALTLEGELNRGQGCPRGTSTPILVAFRARIGLSARPRFFELRPVRHRNAQPWARTPGSGWSFHPLGDLFVVYNHNLDRATDAWHYDDNELLVKVKYGFRY